jgi:glycosyltransferase involved in cell wall biosynthesis
MARTVVHFTDAIEFGGAERMILTLLGGLQARGWRTVLAHHADPGLRRLTEEATALGVETWTVPRMRGIYRLLTAARFARKLRQHAPMLFHAHLTTPLACRYGLIAARVAGLPVIATLHLYMPVSRRAIPVQKLVSLAVDRYIAVSQAVARHLSVLCVGGSRKIRVVYNGVPIAQFERGPSGGMRRAGSHPTVLTIARLHPQKALECLLRAAVLVPEARFLVAGDGRERGALEAQARTLGVTERVAFLGYRDDVAALLRDADVFVLPSLYEGLPVSLLEAMAAGTPVVATAVDGTDEAIVHGESGILVPPRDPVALARAIQDVLADPALARRLVKYGKERVRQHFSAEAAAEGVCDVYREVLGVRRYRLSGA